MAETQRAHSKKKWRELSDLGATKSFPKWAARNTGLISPCGIQTSLVSTHFGIECDGAMYHSSRVARDRDRLRQEVLARLGWSNLHRIWGLSWYWTRGQEEIRLRRAIESAIVGENEEPVPQQPARADAEELIFELSDMPDWAEPYNPVQPSRPRSGVPMHEGAAQGDLQRMIMEVVGGEGPVASEVVLRRVREQWGMHRAGSRARSAFAVASKSLRRKGELMADSDGFLALPNQSEIRVRSGDRSKPETIRNIEEIPATELKEAIVRFVREVHPISEDELTARIAFVFGWTRRGPDIADEFKRVVRRLVSDGSLTRNGALLSPRE